MAGKTNGSRTPKQKTISLKIKFTPEHLQRALENTNMATEETQFLFRVPKSTHLNIDDMILKEANHPKTRMFLHLLAATYYQAKALHRAPFGV